MPRSYIFLMHGVGDQQAGAWSQAWQDKIIQLLRAYAPYDGMSAKQIREQVLCFVPIDYDAAFETHRTKWTHLTGALADSEVIKEGDLKDALTWIANDQDEGLRDAFWTYALDAVLWYGFPIVRADVIQRVLTQISKGVGAMLKENGTGDRAHWIAHSLGTSVLHDCLVTLRHAEKQHEGAFDPGTFKWQSVTMVANTSRLLKAYKSLSDGVTLDAFDPYHSVLRPGLATSATRLYFNINHQLDPISWPLRFAPPDFGAGYEKAQPKSFQDVLAVHDLASYLENPLVHLPMLRAFVGSEQLGTAEEVKRVAADFRLRFPHSMSTAFAELRALFGDNEDKPLSLAEIAKYLGHAYRLLKGDR